MDITSREKPVHFEHYCRKCIYSDRGEHEDPCDECLNEFSNTDTHRPVYFKPAEDENEKD